MKKSYLIIGGSFLLIGGLTALYLYKRKKNKAKSDAQTQDNVVIEQKEKTDINVSSGLDKKSNNIIPSFDNLGNLNNPYKEIQGQVLYATSEGTNLRSSAVVDNTPPDNKVKSYSKDEAIGRVISSTTDDIKKRWFKVKLNKPIKGIFSDTTEGWVREDNITFKPYTPTVSKFSGVIGHSGRATKRLKQNVPDLDIPIERYKPATTGLVMQNMCEIDLGAEVLDNF